MAENSQSEIISSYYLASVTTLDQ